MRFIRGATSVDDVHSLGLTVRDGQIGVADASEKSATFLFKTVFVFVRVPIGIFTFSIAAAGAFDTVDGVVIEQDGEIRLQVSAKDFVQPENGLGTELTASALVGFGGIGKAIAKNDAAFGEGRKDDLVDVLSAGGEHQRHFGERGQPGRGGVQQDLANAFAGRGAAGFAGDSDGETMGAQGASQFLELRAFAAAIESFEGDKFSARGHLGIIAKWPRMGVQAGGES